LGLRAWEVFSHWEGVVEDLTNDGFRARLAPQLNGRLDEAKVQFTDFDFDELSHPSDRDLLQVGAVVYWTIGREVNPAGTRRHTSAVRVRRLPAPTKARLAAAKREADEIRRNLENR
jgi:hypothetical protein